jgi:hypothetical protein
MLAVATALAAVAPFMAVGPAFAAASRLAAGPSIDDPQQSGEWIADVERPAQQFRGRYAIRLDEARGSLSP